MVEVFRDRGTPYLQWSHKCYSKNNYIERVEEEKGRINDKANVVKILTFGEFR